MAKIDKEGNKILNILNVYFIETKDGKRLVDWDFGDRGNAYFTIGVLDVIKDELIQQINEENGEDDE